MCQSFASIDDWIKFVEQYKTELLNCKKGFDNQISLWGLT